MAKAELDFLGDGKARAENGLVTCMGFFEGSSLHLKGIFHWQVSLKTCRSFTFEF